MSKGEIKSKKVLVKEIFSRMWFRVPEYRQPYIWSTEEVTKLLEDLIHAMAEKPDSEYFLGSLVFQSKVADPTEGQEFDENDLIDGQQRMVTLLLIFAVMRDLSNDDKIQETCQGCVYQQGNKYTNTPECTRLFYTRSEIQKFIDEYVRIKGGTNREDELTMIAERKGDALIQNMAKVILNIRQFFNNHEIKIEDFLYFLLNKVVLIYVSTENLEDTLRLFAILNNQK